MRMLITFAKRFLSFIRYLKQTFLNIKFQSTVMEQLEINLNDSYKQKLKKYYGRLLTRRELALSNAQLQSLLKRGLIIKIKAIERKIFKYICNRCGNRDSLMFSKMPCLSCNKVSKYCRKCIYLGRIMSCEFLYYVPERVSTWKKHRQPCTWQGRFNDYQLKGAQTLVHYLNKKKDILLWAITGAGKTEMVFPVITQALRLGMRICLATPRKDVVIELFNRCKRFFPVVSIDALYHDCQAEGTAQFVIATTHQLIRYKRAFDLMIIDEVDAFPFHYDRQLPFVTKRALKKRGVTIYLTATPRKKEKRALLLKRLDYIFIPLRFHKQPLPVPQLCYVFNLNHYLNENKFPPIFMKWLKAYKKHDRQLLIFVPTVKLAKQLLPRLTLILKRYFIINDSSEVAFVHANDDKRDEKIHLFRKKKICVLLTTTILERGVTFPSIDVIVLQACHTVFDEAALIQIAGRAGRSIDDPQGDVLFIHSGKTMAIVNAKQTIVQMNKRAKELKGGI